MARFRNQILARIPLQLALIVPYVLQVVAAVGVTGWLCIRNGQKEINALSAQLRHEVTARIEEDLLNSLSVAHDANQLAIRTFQRENLDSTNVRALRPIFWDHLQVFDFANGVGFANQAGDLVGVSAAEEAGERKYYIEIVDRETNGNLISYDANATSLLTEVKRVSNYDPRSRPWYQAAKTAGILTWSDIYWSLSQSSGNSLAITAAHPLYDDIGEFQGVSFVLLNLQRLSLFLRSIEISDSAEIFIIERSGELVASSSEESLVTTQAGTQTRLLARNSQNDLIRSSAQFLERQFAQFDRVQTIQQLEFTLNRDRQFLQVTPVKDGFGIDWLVVIVLKESDFMGQIQANTRMTIALCVIALMAAVVSGIYTSRWIAHPILRLTAASEAIAAGQCDQRVEVHNTRELGVLARSFNHMAQQVQDSFAELAQTNAELEQRVTERTTELSRTLMNLQQTQAQLIQTEKMSSLGQLVAGVAHEINNPVNFIYGNVVYAQDYAHDLLRLLHLYHQHYPQPTPELQQELETIDLAFLSEDFPKAMISMKMGAERIREIVRSLRTFSRLDEAEFKTVNIHEGIDSTLLILQNRLKGKPDYPGINVIKEYASLPLVECYAGQLNQVFMNILTNAIDALEEYDQSRTLEMINASPSSIQITTQVLDSNWIAVHIADNGPGMSEEVCANLFNPFFTTKPVGKGTGLGLSISYQIVVETHKGFLLCHSILGQGTEFVIKIPIRQAIAA
jgi:signal transduction histidine kinase